jgi:hypothetical protein
LQIRIRNRCTWSAGFDTVGTCISSDGVTIVLEPMNLVSLVLSLALFSKVFVTLFSQIHVPCDDLNLELVNHLTISSSSREKSLLHLWQHVTVIMLSLASGGKKHLGGT